MTQRDPDCIFCKIVAGEIPSARVFEDERTFAFLDIAPLSPGHTLVIPKDHHLLLTDMPAETMAAVGAVLPRVARAVVAATSADGFNLLQANGECAGQEVPHAHLHIIPRRAADGLGFRWKPGSYAEGEMEAMGNRIAEAVARGG
jgi:histidine triad (HIT) family protein